MSIFDKIKSLFSSKEENESTNQTVEIKIEKPEVRILSVAPNVYLACRAAKLCIGKYEVNGNIYDRMKYVEKIVGMGHESILEHTNVVAALIYNTTTFLYAPQELVEVLTNCKYLNVIRKTDNDKTILLIGGSIRGFLYLIRETSIDNWYLEDFKKIIYQSIEKCFLKDLIDKGLLEEDECNFMTYATVDKFSEENPLPEMVQEPIEKKNKTADLIYLTDYDKLAKEISFISNKFTSREINRMCHYTFLFHDISRSCGNQLCRHRNGITQESQRYVTHEYTKEKDFIDPIRMQLDDRYKNLDKKILDKFNTVDFKTYKNMISAGIYKEDARAWLPMNVTTKIMMTFDGFTLAKFLYLRTAKGAQLEIRNLANEILYITFTTIEKYIEFIDTMMTPGFEDIKNDYTEEDIEEVIEESKVEFQDSKIDKEEAERLLKVEEEYKSLEKK